MNAKSLPRGVGIFLLVSCLIVARETRAGLIVDDLTPAQLAQVKAGQQVTVTEDVEGKPWPRFRAYRLVKATPEEAAAVFFDYKHAKDYVPNVLKSDISNQVSPTVTEIDYGIDVPILPDEYYTVRNTLTAEGECYKFHWKLLKAIQTKDSEGAFRAEPFEGYTIIGYYNLVTPGSSMAGLLRGKAISQMKDTVEAIGTHIEKQKACSPNELKREVEALRKALGTK